MSGSDLHALAAQLTVIASTLRDLKPADAEPPAAAAVDGTALAPPPYGGWLLTHVREVERLRAHRRDCFAEVAALIHEPGFDILLLVYRGSLEGQPVTVSAARSAAGGPEPVGARWIDALDAEGLLARSYDSDRGQMHLALSPRGEAMMVRFLAAVLA